MSDENNVINLVDHIEKRKKVNTNYQQEAGKAPAGGYLLKLTPLHMRILAFGVDIFSVGIIKLILSISFSIYVQTFFNELDFSQQVYLFHAMDGLEVLMSGFVFMSYFTLCYYFMEGRTFGKQLLKLRAVKSEFVKDNDNTDLHYGLWDAFMRTSGYFCAYLTLGALYALPFIRRDKRSLADLFSSSMVLTNDEVYNIFAYKTKNLFRKKVAQKEAQNQQNIQEVA
jgi:hypothetical protein